MRCYSFLFMTDKSTRSYTQNYNNGGVLNVMLPNNHPPPSSSTSIPCVNFCTILNLNKNSLAITLMTV